MPAPLSGDLRERIVAAIRDGSSMRGAAARVSVSPSSAIKLMARFRATGSVAMADTAGRFYCRMRSCCGRWSVKGLDMRLTPMLLELEPRLRCPECDARDDSR